MSNIATYVYQDPNVWCILWCACGLGSNKRPKASRNHTEATENIYGQGASKRGNPLARQGGRWFELVDAAPFPKGGGTVHLRYDSWNLCVRSFGGPSPESPIGGGGGVDVPEDPLFFSS